MEKRFNDIERNKDQISGCKEEKNKEITIRIERKDRTWQKTFSLDANGNSTFPKLRLDVPKGYSPFMNDGEYCRIANCTTTPVNKKRKRLTEKDKSGWCEICCKNYDSYFRVCIDTIQY